MYAIRQYAFGPPETLRYEEVPDPSPREGQVRIAVEAAGVHFIDTAIRGGGPVPFPLPDLPMTPGREVAGVIDDVGPGVDPQWLGRRVVAHLGAANGGYAERALAAVAALHPIPDQLTAEAAVAMIGTGRTAIAILDVANITDQDVVVVTAAAGGLGSLFIQAARNAGATVVGAAGGQEKVERVRATGATVAVDYQRPAWAAQVRTALNGRPATVVLDGVGGAIGRAAMELLGAGGRLLLFGWASGEWTPVTAEDLYTLGITVTVPIGRRLSAHPDGIRGLEARSLAEAAAGRLVPVVGRRFPLAEAAAAHAAVESRDTIGKTVLVP